jgi:hypothetical protein
MARRAAPSRGGLPRRGRLPRLQLPRTAAPACSSLPQWPPASRAPSAAAALGRGAGTGVEASIASYVPDPTTVGRQQREHGRPRLLRRRDLVQMHLAGRPSSKGRFCKHGQIWFGMEKISRKLFRFFITNLEY